MAEEKTNRTRFNFGQNARGLVQMDITCEYDTPEQAAAASETAIPLYREICKKMGLRLVDDGLATEAPKA